MAELLHASMHGQNAPGEFEEGWPRTEITATENEAETTADEVCATFENGGMKIYIEATRAIGKIKETDRDELNEPHVFMTIWNGEELLEVFAGTWEELAEAIETARKAKKAKARAESETASN